MSCPASAGPGVFTRHTDCTCSRHTEALRHRGRVSSCHRAPLYETRRRSDARFSLSHVGLPGRGAVGACRHSAQPESERSDSSSRVRSARSVPYRASNGGACRDGCRWNQPLLAAGAEGYERRELSRHAESASRTGRATCDVSSQRGMRRVCSYDGAGNRNRSRSAPASTNITITGTIAGRAAMPMPTRGTNAAIPVQTTSMTTAKLTS